MIERCSLRVALVKAGEPIPDLQVGRTQRMGALASELLGRGHTVTWYTNGVDRMTGKQLVEDTTRFRTNNGIDMVVFKVPGFARRTSPLRLLAQFLTALKTAFAMIARERDFDVVVVSYPYLESAFLCTLAARLTGTPSIVDVRDLFPDNYEDAMGRVPRLARQIILWPFNLMARQSFRLATQRVAISDDFLRWMCDSFGVPPRDSDSSIPLPSPRRFGMAPSGALQLEERRDAVQLLYVGSLNRIIDLETVVRAVRVLVAQGESIRLTVVGDGERADGLRAAVGDATCVDLLGWLGPDQVEQELARADWGVAPYELARASGMGNKYFEYLGAGLPVATSDQLIAQQLETAGAGGFIDLASVDSCAQSLSSLLRRPVPTRVDLENFYASAMMGGRSERHFADLIERLVGICD